MDFWQDSKNALKVAVVVGLLLNLINQGPALVRMDWKEVIFWKLGFNFLVPWAVAFYSAQKARVNCRAENL